MKSLMPNIFPTQNTHRLVHLTPQPDYERLEEMTADAIAHLRAAVDAVHTLPEADRKALPVQIRALVTHALSGDVLSPDMQDAAMDVLTVLDRIVARGSADETVRQMCADIRAAMDLGRRVFDLIIAEHRIGEMRLALVKDLLDDE